MRACPLPCIWQTRTNTAAWLDFQQDDVVARLERILANVTGTEPGNVRASYCGHGYSKPVIAEHALCSSDICRISDPGGHASSVPTIFARFLNTLRIAPMHEILDAI